MDVILCRCVFIFSLIILTTKFVAAGPKWIRKPSDRNVTVGSNTTFYCEVAGLDNPIVIWNKGVTPLFINGARSQHVPDRYTIEGKNNLVINSVVLTDDSFFTCSIFGFHSAQVKLTVQSPSYNQNADNRGPGNCDFSSQTDKCGYTFGPRWIVQKGDYSIGPYVIAPKTQGHGSYVFFDSRPPITALNKTGTEESHNTTYDLISPEIPPGQYNLTFWYILTLYASQLDVLVDNRVVERKVFDPNQERRWRQLTINLKENTPFRIVYRGYEIFNSRGVRLTSDLGLDNITIIPVTENASVRSTPMPTATAFISTAANLITTQAVSTYETITPISTTHGIKTSKSIHTEAPISYTSLPDIISSTTSRLPTKTYLEKALTASCTSTKWNISIDMGELRHDYPHASRDNIFLRETSCLGDIKGQFLLFTWGLNECSTSHKKSVDNIIYETNVYYEITDPDQPFIARQPGWTYTVECDITRNVANSSHIHHDIESHHVSVNAEFDINIAFYRDPNFMEKITGNPLHVSVGDAVYVKVFTTTADWTVKMRLHTCYTKPNDTADDKLIYYIIKNGCEVDRNTHLMSQSTHETRFMFQDFEYTTYHEGLDVYCNATFCNADDFSRECTQMCQSP